MNPDMKNAWNCNWTGQTSEQLLKWNSAKVVPPGQWSHQLLNAMFGVACHGVSSSKKKGKIGVVVKRFPSCTAFWQQKKAVKSGKLRDGMTRSNSIWEDWGCCAFFLPCSFFETYPEPKKRTSQMVFLTLQEATAQPLKSSVAAFKSGQATKPAMLGRWEMRGGEAQRALSIQTQTQILDILI